eukprot:6987836-Alexandrium_andersonii.AAC.1
MCIRDSISTLGCTPTGNRAFMGKSKRVCTRTGTRTRKALPPLHAHDRASACARLIKSMATS